MKVKEIIEKGISIYKDMQSSRYLSSIRSEKTELTQLEKINQNVDTLYDEKLLKDLKNLQTSLAQQDSKIKTVVDLIIICVLVSVKEIEPVTAFTNIRTLEVNVKNKYDSNWSLKGDPVFSANYHQLVLLASNFINQFVLTEDKTLLTSAINHEEQLALTESCIKRKEQEVQSQGQKLNELDQLHDRHQKQFVDTKFKINQSKEQYLTVKQTESQILVANSLRETLKQQEELLQKIEQEKTQAAMQLRIKMSEFNSLQERKDKQTAELLRVQRTIENLVKEKNVARQQYQELLLKNQDLEIRVQDAEQKCSAVASYFLCSEEDFGNITRQDLKKLKEIRSSEKSYYQKYQNLVTIDHGAVQNLADILYMRYKDVYQKIFGPNKGPQSQENNQKDENGEVELKRIQMEIDCGKLTAWISNHYTLAGVARRAELIVPETEQDEQVKVRIGQIDELSKAKSEFAEETVKRIENFLKNNVEEWEKKYANFASRNLEQIDRCIAKDIKKDLANMKQMLSKP